MNKVYNNKNSNTDLIKLQVRDLIQKQRDYFSNGNTRTIEKRIHSLQKLKKTIKSHEEDILNALYEDLRKSEFEAYSAEIGFVYQEIDHTLKHLKKWAKKRKVKTPLVLQPAKSWIQPEPLGSVLIIAPWNYPFQLAVAPLVSALAAGNTAIIKPSSVTTATSATLRRIIDIAFDNQYVAVVEGNHEIGDFLLSEKFDHIFFTGSPGVGAKVMKAASEYLTPVTLELGGKSPVIVDEHARIHEAARKIAWGKYLNAGQTCIAPDYVLVHHAVKDEFISEMKKVLKDYYGDDPAKSRDYPRIINEKHFNRLSNLIRKKHVVHGGSMNKKDLYIEPTILENLPDNSPIMKEEIFGPLLPVQEIDSIEEAVTYINSRPNLWLCIFFQTTMST
jgi:aldehyde dehydrogenase (NAD+)